MKTTKAYEHEYMLNNVTPAQFLAYLRKQAKKHPGELCNDFSLREFRSPSMEWNSKYSEALPSEHPCQSEIVVMKPYEQQTYIRNFDGSTHNEILEFQFFDDTTGNGYYYTVQIDVADEDVDANTEENVARISARRAAVADRQEAHAEKIDAETDRAERNGYADRLWIDFQRTEAARLRRDAAETRAAIKAAQGPTEEDLDAAVYESVREEIEGAQAANDAIIDSAAAPLEAQNPRSAWGRAVRDDALDMVGDLREWIHAGDYDGAILRDPAAVESALLNGAPNWSRYSWGGCALVYDGDIAAHYCTPSELKRTRSGERRPNSSEDWLDVQARALFQAAAMVKEAIRAAIGAAYLDTIRASAI